MCSACRYHLYPSSQPCFSYKSSNTAVAAATAASTEAMQRACCSTQPKDVGWVAEPKATASMLHGLLIPMVNQHTDSSAAAIAASPHLCAVAMVYVKVHNCHPADMVVVDGCQRSAGHVVEDAVSASSATLCMVTRRPAGHILNQRHIQHTKCSCSLLPTRHNFCLPADTVC